MGQQNSYIYDVTEQDFDTKVLAASNARPVMVDFWAEWCPPCRALTPVLEAVTQCYKGRIVLARLEVDDNMRLAGRYKVRGFPTVILFKDRAETARFSSFRPTSAVHAFLEMYLAQD